MQQVCQKEQEESVGSRYCRHEVVNLIQETPRSFRVVLEQIVWFESMMNTLYLNDYNDIIGVEAEEGWPISTDENVAQIILLAQNNDVPLDSQQFKTLDLKWHQFNWKSLTEALELLTSKKVKKMVLGDSNFYFRFRSIIQFCHCDLWMIKRKRK